MSKQALQDTTANSIKAVTVGMDGMEEAIAEGSKSARTMVQGLDTAGAKAQQKVATFITTTSAQVDQAAETVTNKLKIASEAPAMLAQNMFVLQQDYMNLFMKSLSRTASLGSEIRNSHSVPQIFDAQRRFVQESIADLTALNAALLDRSTQFWPIYKTSLGA